MIARRKRRRRRIVVKQRARIRRKSEHKDTLRNAPTRLAPDVGTNFRVKIKKKNGS